MRYYRGKQERKETVPGILYLKAQQKRELNTGRPPLPNSTGNVYLASAVGMLQGSWGSPPVLADLMIFFMGPTAISSSPNRSRCR